MTGKRGRPKGSYKGVYLRKSPRWVPKKWEPMYDQWVALSVGGWSNIRIGEHFGYTPQQVCNVLTTPQALALKQLLSESIRKRMHEDTANRLAALEQRAIHNVETVLTNDELLSKNPMAMADRSMAFLKGVGKLEGDKGKEIEKERTLVVPSELIEKLVGGMDKANEALLKFGNTEVRRLPDGSGREDVKGDTRQSK